MIGRQLGPYEVVAKIGEGGMGEVYKARDPRLGRDVAVKVLPSSFARDPDRRARFEREARAVAALSHPNILGIYDLGVHDDQLFVAMELLDGETVRERLAHGPLPVRKAIDIAIQIARGLAAAHDKRLIHRDLKPENVFLLRDGHVKILDFGLAREADVAPADDAATVTRGAFTEPGVVMGTVGYMAPEQVRGGAVDPRTDLFALGVVFYEMLTGARAFQRGTAAETMTAILRDDPPALMAARAEVSPAIDRIVHHCLEKDPGARFQSARDVAFALETLTGTTRSTSGATVVTPSRRGLPAWLTVAAATGIGVALFAAGRWTAEPARGPATEFSTLTYQQQAIFNARFMPDGRTVVFSAAAEGEEPSLFVVRPDSPAQQPVGAPRMHLLSISPSGELLVVTDARRLESKLFRGTLARMTLDGAPRPLLDDVREADWAPDGTLAIIRDTGSRDRLEYPPGTVMHESGGYLSDLRVSRDGTKVAFLSHPSRYDDRGFVHVVTRGSGVTTLSEELHGIEGLAWTADDASLVFSGSYAHEKFPYRPKMVSAGGGPVTPAWPTPGNMWVHDVAADGRVLATREDLFWGIGARLPGQTAERDLSWAQSSWAPHLSKDGKQVLFTVGMGELNYTLNLRGTDGSPVSRIGEGNAHGFSPDGRWAASILPSPPQIVIYPTGVGDPIRLPRGPIVEFAGFSWFPDSRRVLFGGYEGSHQLAIYQQSLTGGPPERLPQVPPITSRLLHRDGTRVLGLARDGRWAVYRLADGVAKPAAGLGADDIPIAWGSDGESVLVRRGFDQLVRINIASGATISQVTVGPPTRTGLTELRLISAIDDGRGYSYQYGRRLSTAFVVTGVAGR